MDLADLIYFDNAATSLPKHPAVIQAVNEILTSYNCGNPGRSTHYPAQNSWQILEHTRQSVAKFFGLDPELSYISNNCGVAFAPGATFAANLLLQSVIPEGSHIITTAYEHNSFIRPLTFMQEQGKISLSKIPLSDNGSLDYEVVEDLITNNTFALVVNHASNVNGVVTDIDLLSRLAQKYKLFLILDTAQTAGMIPINMTSDKIDALIFTGHKSLGAMMGVGGICINNPKLHLKPVFLGGTGTETFNTIPSCSNPHYFECGTPSIPAIYSLQISLEHHNFKRQAFKVMDYFLDLAQVIPNFQLYAEYQGLKYVPCCAFNLGNIPADEIASILQENNICCRAGFHCAPDFHRHFKTENQGIVRFSFSHHNTFEEVETAVKILSENF